VMVTENLKTQESVQQDLETWRHAAGSARSSGNHPEKDSGALFYPAWETLPHEGRLPHADVIAERLQTLVALSTSDPRPSPLIVTSVTALLQKTFNPDDLRQRTGGPGFTKG
jgi:transcription-repair coupling factor (superfamily II helicase)